MALFVVVPSLTLSTGLYPWRDHPRLIQPVPTVFTAMLLILCSVLANLLAGMALGPGAGASPLWKRMLGALVMFLLLMFFVAAVLFGVFLG